MFHLGHADETRVEWKYGIKVEMKLKLECKISLDFYLFTHLFNYTKQMNRKEIETRTFYSIILFHHTKHDLNMRNGGEEGKPRRELRIAERLHPLWTDEDGLWYIVGSSRQAPREAQLLLAHVA